MTETSFYTREELQKLNLKSFGRKVLISRNAKMYNVSNIEIGDNVRIDDFCILSGKIKLGSHIHIASGVYMFAGDAGIEVEDFSGLSPRCSVFAISDNFSGQWLTSPVIYDEYRNVSSKKIILKKYTLVGTDTVILPGVIMAEGSTVGAKSLVRKKTEPWTVYNGSPAKKIKARSKDLLNLEKKFLKTWNSENAY
ncbi:galactoside O-acetyltransferase [PVC group bacterium (ex Bugula neritina AB1)]|nr:galactoside O-acetyltransferase [PVC group bacterium (ex Bugula neritina AB1)]